MAGRPPFEATDEERKLVLALASYGIPQPMMCLLITRPRGKAGTPTPISEPTLRKHFRTELDTGEPSLIAKVADSLVKTALDRKHPGHVVAARFFLKARAGWRETDRVTHDGAVDFNLDLSGATDEELVVLQKFLRRKVGDAAPAAANSNIAA
jgi:hypothetical protein